MRKFQYFAAAALAASILPFSLAHAEDFITVTKPSHAITAPRRPVAPKTSSVDLATPSTPESVRAAVNKNVENLFDRAADPEKHIVTQQSAKQAGIGFLADHFAEIDRDRDGNLRFSEVKRFFDARSPAAIRPAGSVQIVE